MITSEFFEALNQIAHEKGIPKDTVVSAIEQALLAAYRKKLGQETNLQVEIVEAEKAIRVFQVLEIVEDDFPDFQPELHLPYSQAHELSPDLRVGDQIHQEIFPEDVGRIAAQTVKQVVIQKIREAERKMLYTEYSKRIGQLMNGTVHRVELRSMLVDLGRAEAVLPHKEQIPRQSFKVGDPIKVCVSNVEMRTKGPVIEVSRANSDFLIGLFKYYIPEIQEGIVKIRAVVREPGIRSKISVYCDDPRIDPVGACVGLKGARIKDIVSELAGEKIDIIKWNSDLSVYVMNALSPAKVTSITLQPTLDQSLVVVPDHMLSLAIGREGQNVRLAAKLTGVRIDIKSEMQYKEYLTQLMDGKLAELAAVAEAEAAAAGGPAVEPGDEPGGAPDPVEPTPDSASAAEPEAGTLSENGADNTVVPVTDAASAAQV